jgi:hypothetical protein
MPLSCDVQGGCSVGGPVRTVPSARVEPVAPRFLTHGQHPLVDPVLGGAGDRAGAIATPPPSADSAVPDLPAQCIGDGLRRSPRELETLVRQRVDQLGDRLGSVLGEVHRECVSELDSAQCSWGGHGETMARSHDTSGEMSLVGGQTSSCLERQRRSECRVSPAGWCATGRRRLPSRQAPQDNSAMIHTPRRWRAAPRTGSPRARRAPPR